MVKSREFQVGHDGGDEVCAGDELLDLVVEKRQLEATFQVRLRQAEAGGPRVGLGLMFVVDDQAAKAEEFDGGHPLVSAVIEMLDLGGELLGECLLYPLPP